MAGAIQPETQTAAAKHDRDSARDKRHQRTWLKIQKCINVSSCITGPVKERKQTNFLPGPNTEEQLMIRNSFNHLMQNNQSESGVGGTHKMWISACYTLNTASPAKQF